MALTPAEIQAKIDKLEVNMERLNQFTNGDENTEVTIDNGTVPSITKYLNDITYDIGDVTAPMGLRVDAISNGTDTDFTLNTPVPASNGHLYLNVYLGSAFQMKDGLTYSVVDDGATLRLSQPAPNGTRVYAETATTLGTTIIDPGNGGGGGGGGEALPTLTTAGHTLRVNSTVSGAEWVDPGDIALTTWTSERSRTMRERSRRVAHLDDFSGADPTGASSSLSAIKKMLTQATTARVWAELPAGKFAIEDTLGTYNGLRLRGAGSGFWRANPPASWWTADAADDPNTSRIILTGNAPKTFTIDGITSCRQLGYDRTLSKIGVTRQQSNALDSEFLLLDLTNENASGVTPASLKSFSAALYLGTTNAAPRTNELRDFMIVPNCPGTGETVGTRGYGDLTAMRPFADWDFGLVGRGISMTSINKVAVVGYYRHRGVLLTAGTINDPSNGQGEHVHWKQGYIQGGLAIRDGDNWPIIAKSASQITVMWTPSHTFPATGSLQNSDGTTFNYTGKSFSSTREALTFTGINSTSFINEVVTTATANSSTDVYTLSSSSVYNSISDGDPVYFTTSGTLPGGMVGTENQPFRAYKQGGTNIKLANTRALGEAGTFIDLTSTGSGTHTLHFITRDSSSVIGKTRNAGVSHTSFEDMYVADYGHSTRLEPCNTTSFGAQATRHRAAIEASGDPMRALYFKLVTPMVSGPLAIHLGRAQNVEFERIYTEPKAGKGSLSGSFLSTGACFIAGPKGSMINEVGVDNLPSIFMKGVDMVGSVNLAPLWPANTGRVNGATDLFNVSYAFNERKERGLGVTAVNNSPAVVLTGPQNYDLGFQRYYNGGLRDVFRYLAASDTHRIGDSAEHCLNLHGSGNFAPGSDNQQTNGTSSSRWSTVYAGTGSISTSDEREKTDIESIPDSWLDAWGEIEWSRYKWKNSVIEKGRKARWHVGLIAQHVEKIFKDHGLDAFEIGLLCYDEWDAGKDGSSGYGERYGLRYDECFALESAYQRRRLDRIEKSLNI